VFEHRVSPFFSLPSIPLPPGFRLFFSPRVSQPLFREVLGLLAFFPPTLQDTSPPNRATRGPQVFLISEERSECFFFLFPPFFVRVLFFCLLSLPHSHPRANCVSKTPAGAATPCISITPLSHCSSARVLVFPQIFLSFRSVYQGRKTITPAREIIRQFSEHARPPVYLTLVFLFFVALFSLKRRSTHGLIFAFPVAHCLVRIFWRAVNLSSVPIRPDWIGAFPFPVFCLVCDSGFPPARVPGFRVPEGGC